MFRKSKKYPSIKNKEYSIKVPSSSDYYEIGQWGKLYSLKLCYQIDRDVYYSDIVYTLTSDKAICGYFMAYSIVNKDENDYIPLYYKKMVLYDFAIFHKAYAKYGKILLEYMIDYARYNGYSVIEIVNNDEYSYFINFVNENYNLKQINNTYYIEIENTRISSCRKNLYIYNTDSKQLSIDNLYYLYDLGFDVLKTKCRYKLNDNESIVVNRSTGLIEFPSNTITNSNIYLKDNTRSIILLIIEMYKANEIKNVYINLYPEYFEAKIDNDLYVSIDSYKLNDDIDYINNKINDGINLIYSYIIKYDMNETSFSKMVGAVKPIEVLKKKSFNLFTADLSLKDKMPIMKKDKEFNSKLSSLKRIKFQSGTSFSGIKKLLIELDEEVSVRSNSLNKPDINPDKAEVINDLECLHIGLWDDRYVNTIIIDENCWTLELVFDDERFEFSGINAYPPTIQFFEMFVKKYANFELKEE